LVVEVQARLDDFALGLPSGVDVRGGVDFIADRPVELPVFSMLVLAYDLFGHWIRRSRGMGLGSVQGRDVDEVYKEPPEVIRGLRGITFTDIGKAKVG